MNLTTHEWAAFWTFAVTINHDAGRLRQECDLVEALAFSSRLLVDYPPYVPDDEFNDTMFRNFKHLVEEHGLRPSDHNRLIKVSPHAKALFPAYTKALRWLVDRVNA